MVKHTTQEAVTYSTLALRMVFLNDSKTERWTMGSRMGLKSAPIRLKDSPKYKHWLRTESSRPPTPADKSASSVWRKSQIW